MFDSTPPNLPVEPAAPVPLKTAAPPAPPRPAAPAGPGPKPVPAVPLTTKGKKEPEDIFSGLDAAAEQKAANEGMTMAEAPKQNPLVVAGVVVAGLLVLGAAGYVVWAYVLHPTSPSAPVVVPTTSPTPRIPSGQIEQPPVTQQPAPAPIPTPNPNPAASSSAPTPVTQPPAGINIPIPNLPTPGGRRAKVLIRTATN